MKIYVQLLLVVLFFIKFANFGFCYEPEAGVVTVKKEEVPSGTWKTKTKWKAYWVKHWETRTVYVPVWRKVWAPVEVREWLPFPEPQSGWKRQ